jgi:phage terminase small subunit
MKTKTTPPSHLGATGKALWTSLFRDYEIGDGAGLALLRAAAEAADRAEGARLEIKRDGITVADRFGQRKPHPSIATERDARGQMIAALRALKLAPGAAQ